MARKIYRKNITGERKWLCLLLFSLFAYACPAQVRSLSDYIRTARENSPTLKEYQNQVLSLQIDSQLLRASQRMQVDFLSNNSYAPFIKGHGYDPAITNIANVSALIQASRNFISPANRSAQVQTIALQRKALLDTIQLSQQELVRTITDQYITAYGDLLSLDYNKEVFELMQREEEALKKLTQASVFKQTDYLTFYVTMQQQELTYLQSQIQYNNDYLTLNYLAGVVDTTIERIEKPILSDSLKTDFYHSAFALRFTTDSLRLANEKALIAFEYKPRIGAYTDAGYNSSLQFAPYNNFGFSLGLSIRIPIYDGHQRQMKESRIDIQEKTRQSNQAFYLNQYRMQLAQLRQQMMSIDLMVNKINKQIEYAHTLIVANGKLLETGDITMKDYVTAVNNYLGARNMLTQNNVSRLRILNQISYWNINP